MTASGIVRRICYSRPPNVGSARTTPPPSNPCAPCAEAPRRRPPRRLSALPPTKWGLGAHEALALATGAMLRGQPVPAEAYGAIAAVNAAELEAMASDVITDLREVDEDSGPIGAERVARAVCVLEAFRQIEPGRASAFVRSRYDATCGTYGAAVLLSTGRRIHSPEMARFFVARLSDTTRTGRDGSACDDAMQYLSRYFRDGTARKDVGDAVVRMELQARWAARLG